MAREWGLDGHPAVHLDCPGQSDPSQHVRNVTAAVMPWLTDPPPLLVVQGDTSSALGAALAGFMARVPVAHVEAGLRTHDPSQPWPEEEYRKAIDAQADLLFAPTDDAAENLAREKVSGEVYVTGNTGIDALLAAVALLPPRPTGSNSPAKLLVTCHRRESWGTGLTEIAAAVRSLAADGLARVEFVLHPNPDVANRMTKMLGDLPNVTLRNPCSHGALIELMRNATIILSDSGGIQEEAPALGVPLLVLREKTERPEGVRSGNMRLVGTSAACILAHVRALQSEKKALAAMSEPAFPYGDGRSAPRIVSLIEEWLARTSCSSAPHRRVPL